MSVSPSAADLLAEMHRLMATIPAPPFFAACRMFPSDRAMVFEHEGREHIGAHPDLWAKVPAQKSSDPLGLGLNRIEIIDLDLSVNSRHRAAFFGAMAQVMLQGGADNER